MTRSSPPASMLSEPNPGAGSELTFESGGDTLAGTLHHPIEHLDRPASGGQTAAVLMLQGSGPADRDCGGYFTEIRRAFLDRGIATFAFDKPGCGDSTGDWRRHGLADRANQAEAALARLAAHPAVDPGRLGIWGQSQGGWLVQLLAGRGVPLAFAVANSGPSIGVAEQDLYGCEHVLRAKGHPEADIERALALLEEVHAAAVRGDGFAELDAHVLAPARSEPWYGYATINDADDWYLTRLLVTEPFEPLEALARVGCPFLAIYGGLDLLVPAWRGAEETGRALRAAGNHDSTVVVFPGGDHRITDPASGALAPGYLDLLGDWAAARVE